MIAGVIALIVLAIWIGLAATGFWRTDQYDARLSLASPEQWPDVVAVVPARDEADVIARSIGSLAAQDYPGNFRILLVDDDSSDGTGDVARSIASDRVTVLRGKTLAAGWTGKLWALSQGIAAAGTPDYLWLTDADIAHAPDTLRTLVSIAKAGDRQLVSFMARLHCDRRAERALIPAFVWFFQLLYPFAKVNRPGRMAGAAGGCVLVRRDGLEQAGGIGAIRGALIDDCTLGALMKTQGPIWLGLTDRSRSIRPYEDAGAIARMIARSAYAQLHYSPWRLAGTLVGLALVYLSPPVFAVFGTGLAQWAGLAAWLVMAALFQPMLAFYRRSPLWGLALPGIAAFYSGCTFLSAWQHARGRGGMWKGRAQAALGQ
ncbi:glycosyltransferase [Sphingomonas sp. AP4-R1]|uniref:glycosyltransferase n=1 Tax=Sphingomonas sp. AP4-R1 TaxID=2735134 RepID=UPI0014939BC6|nr:glycosyltransferase [Sphingomonas sp. AP4-R1]QJU57511.1 glycosyltransferase [Sphingomonas sp. AP4-R1]